MHFVQKSHSRNRMKIYHDFPKFGEEGEYFVTNKLRFHLCMYPLAQ